jgi:hypothetical protein
VQSNESRELVCIYSDASPILLTKEKEVARPYQPNSIFRSKAANMFSPDYFHTASAPKLQDYHDYAQAHIRDRRISLSPLAKKWLRNYREPYKGFTSDGNIISGLWKSSPHANGPTQEMVNAAQFLLSVASPNEKARFRHLVTAREWRAWSNPEVRDHIAGVVKTSH